MMSKRAAIILLMLCAGCTSKTTDKEITASVEARKAIAEKLHGYWLSNSYLEKISSTKSIYESREYSTRFWGFTLDKHNLMTDSATIDGFMEHEGGYTCSITFDSTKNCFINNLKDPTGHSFVEEPFTMTVLDNGLLQLDFGSVKEEYRKVVDDQTALRKLLFEGRFKQLATDITIDFSDDGKVKGFGNDTYFELVNDFVEGVFYDVAIFYPAQDSSGNWTRGKLFHYKINGDTLKLYPITPDWQELAHKIEDLKYLLVKM